mgnify:CR=1 FL=1
MNTYFSNYNALLKNLEELCSKISEQYYRDIQCKNKCCSCCISGLTLLPIEASYIKDSIKNIKVTPNKKAGECLFLKDRSCQIYEFRPLVCRTQGFILLYRDDEKEQTHISHCELNFKDQFLKNSINGKNIIDMDKINTILASINIEFSNKYNFNKEERTPLESLYLA